MNNISKRRNFLFLSFLCPLPPVLSFCVSNPPHFSLCVMFVCFIGVVPLREQRACYSGLMSLLCTNLVWQRQEAPTDWWHFIVIAVPLLTVHHSCFCCWGLLPREWVKKKERDATQKQQIENIVTVIQKKTINLGPMYKIAILMLYFLLCIFTPPHVPICHKDLMYITLCKDKYLICVARSLL